MVDCEQVERKQLIICRCVRQSVQHPNSTVTVLHIYGIEASVYLDYSGEGNATEKAAGGRFLNRGLTRGGGACNLSRSLCYRD